jgi:hypothetical protein
MICDFQDMINHAPVLFDDLLRATGLPIPIVDRGAERLIAEDGAMNFARRETSESA